MSKLHICDDEPHIVEGLRHLLRGADRTIVTSRSGAEALRRIREDVPDLLITDIMMPEMSGLELIAALREDDATRELPVIILTAKGQAQDTNLAQEVWGATVLGKPFDPIAVRKLVASILERSPCVPNAST